LYCYDPDGGTAPPVGTLEWSCSPPPTLTPPCPTLVPNEGTPCEIDPNVHCPWGLCYRLDVACVDGRWVWSHPFTGCPVCASPDTPIATPDGERAIATIKVGDLVYSVVGQSIEPVPVIRVGHTPVSHHSVMRVKMANGRTLEISAGHPTADGRLFGDLRQGTMLDGQRIESVEVVPYRHAATYDILTASKGGTYFAAGMLIGSTLGP